MANEPEIDDAVASRLRASPTRRSLLLVGGIRTVSAATMVSARANPGRGIDGLANAPLCRHRPVLAMDARGTVTKLKLAAKGTAICTAAPGESACCNGYAHLPTSHTALQFCTDAEAKSRCPSTPVVWVNTKSKVYHYARTSFYGHAKVGAYTCESDATAEGDRERRRTALSGPYCGGLHRSKLR